jgi:DNA-nicking Smr family endonuclease
VSSREKRPLSADEHAVWDGVTRSIKPLRRRIAAKISTPAVTESKGVSGRAPPKPRPMPAAQPMPVRHSPQPTSLDRRTRQKLARGSQPIDARIDLHGLTQSEAHHALARFLRNAQRDGARFVLVITGKGGPRVDVSAGERGVLRRQVPLWLKLPEFRSFVVGFEEAHVGHGGGGALYVQVRRARSAS